MLPFQCKHEPKNPACFSSTCNEDTPIDLPEGRKTALSSYDDSTISVRQSDVNERDQEQLTNGNLGITTAKTARKLMVKYVKS